jgi:hypothetical protein
MGFVSSLWPVLCFVIVTALWLQKKNTTFWSIAYPIIGIFAFSFWEGSALLCLPPFLMVALQKYWKTQHAWKVVLPTTALIMVVCIERATSPTHLMPLINPWLSEFPLIIGLLMVGGWINGFKAEVSVPESWIWGTLPIVAFGVGGSPLPPALVVIALFYVLSILHVQWWEHLSAKHNFSLCLALSCLVFHPSSQTVRGLRQRLEHDSEQQLLALEAKRYLEGEHQLVLCSIPTLAPLLRVSLAPSPVLVYPNAHLNTSHLHIGKKGVWIHDGQQSANHHLHLENARLWKKLDHRTEIQHSTLIDRFDRLLYPF